MFHRLVFSTLAATLFLASLATAQSNTTCEVSGTLHKPDGTPAANAQVTIVKVAQNGTWVSGYPQTLNTDANGFVDFTVPANSTAYILVNGVDGLNVTNGAPIQIPDAATVAFETL